MKFGKLILRLQVYRLNNFRPSLPQQFTPCLGFKPFVDITKKVSPKSFILRACTYYTETRDLVDLTIFFMYFEINVDNN